MHRYLSHELNSVIYLKDDMIRNEVRVHICTIASSLGMVNEFCNIFAIRTNCISIVVFCLS